MRIRTSKLSTLLLLLVLALGVTGCGGGGSGPALAVPADPTVATQAELESLFDQISLQLSSAKPGSNRAVDLTNQLAMVGGELAERAAAATRTRLSQVDRIDGQLPLGAIERELGGLPALKRWDANGPWQAQQRAPAGSRRHAPRHQGTRGQARGDHGS